MAPATTEYATLEQMQAWAQAIMASRAPDVVIGEDYLRRWWIAPRNAYANVYLHEFRRSDDDRALHDHPWGDASYLISGAYIEHTPHGSYRREAGDYVARDPRDLHRVELIDGAPAISLFTTGPKVRDWGFACPQGWVPWQEFCHPTDPTKVGRGCGEATASSLSGTGQADPRFSAEIAQVRAFERRSWPVEELNALPFAADPLIVQFQSASAPLIIGFDPGSKADDCGVVTGVDRFGKPVEDPLSLIGAVA